MRAKILFIDDVNVCVFSKSCMLQTHCLQIISQQQCT